MAMLSILALYNYDENIFDGMDVPEGMSKVTTVENILLECAELSLLYTNPVFMKKAIKQWSDKEQKIWQKLYDTENLDYNPIWNVDAEIVENETIDRDKAASASEGESISTDITDTTSRAGYNSGDWQNFEKNVRDMDTTGRRNNSGTENEDVDRELTTRRTGNIGVTTTQEMIKQEREIAQFNTIDYITNSFKRRFCVMVY